MALSLGVNTAVSTVGRVLGFVVSLLTLGYTYQYLQAAGYGDYSTAGALVFVFNSLADLGLYSVLVRDISKPNADLKGLVSSALTLRLLALVVFLGLASVVAFQLPYNHATKVAVIVIGLSNVFLSLSQVLMAVFQRFLRTDRAAIAEVVGRVALLGLVLLFIKLDGSLVGIAWAAALSAAASFALTAYFARKFVPFTLSFKISYWQKLLKESWPIALALVFVVMYFKLDTVILSLFQPAADVGIYNMGYALLQALIFFPAMFAGLVMPFLSRHGLSQPGRFKKVFGETLNLFIVFTLPLGVFLIARAHDLIALIYQGENLAATTTLQILALAIMAIYFGALFSNGLIALHRQKTLLWIYALGAAVNVSLNLLLIPKYSYLAASWTTVVTETIVTLLMIVMLSHFAKTAFSWARFLPAILASVPLAAGLLLTESLNILLVAPLAAAIYLGALWLLGGLTKTDLDFVSQKELG